MSAPSAALCPTVAADRLPDALLRAQAHPQAVPTPRLIETAISWVILAGDHAYKIKKPLRNDFIDASSVERRLFLCLEELRLNQRYSQDLYLDVVPIGCDERGIGFCRSRTVIDYAVRMRQFDAAAQLTRALKDRRVSIAEMEQFGITLARLHRAAPSVVPEASYGTAATLAEQILANFAPLRAALQTDDSALQILEALEAWCEEKLQTLGTLVAARRARGRVRECHGDLHAGNIIQWQGHWTPFDCLEFDPTLRWIDVMSDVGFLFMDLAAHSEPHLAYALLNGYLDEGGDYEGVLLLPLFGVYRALVRAKVAALSHDPEVLRHYVATAAALMCRHQAGLVLMHGVAASGKSSIALALAQTLPAIWVRSDRERQRPNDESRLAGQIHGGRYTPDRIHATYERLRMYAHYALSAGYPVIVDATFLKRARRREFANLADQLGCPRVMVACEAPLTLLQQRLQARRARGTDLSEATSEVLAAQCREREAFEEDEERYVVTVNSAIPTAAAAAAVAVRHRLEPR